jgi:hypothetical protein
MPDPEIKLAVLCDDVRQEVGNKFSLMGLFDRFGVSDFTQSLPPFRVFIKMHFLTEGEHRFALNVRSGEGDFSVGLQGVLSATEKEQASGRYSAHLNIGFNQLKVPREGVYNIEIVCDDKSVASIPFQVATVRPPTLQ